MVNYEYLFLGVEPYKPYSNVDKDTLVLFNWYKKQHEYKRWSGLFKRYQSMFKKDYIFDPVSLADIAFDAPRETWHLEYGKHVDSKKYPELYSSDIYPVEYSKVQYIWKYGGVEGEILVFNTPVENEKYCFKRTRENVFISLDEVPNVIQKYLDLEVPHEPFKDGEYIDEEFFDYIKNHNYIRKEYIEFREYCLKKGVVNKEFIFVEER